MNDELEKMEIIKAKIKNIQNKLENLCCLFTWERSNGIINSCICNIGSLIESASRLLERALFSFVQRYVRYMCLIILFFE